MIQADDKFPLGSMSSITRRGFVADGVASWTLGAAGRALPAGTIAPDTGGPMDFQVLQRNNTGTASFQVAGRADENGMPIEIRLTRKHQPVPAFDWRTFAVVESNRWAGTLSGVPTGGPYSIEIRPAGGARRVVAQQLLVGDLWLLAGQSNMEGYGLLDGAELGHELVHSFDMADQWLVAEEPLHTLATAVDSVHLPHDASGNIVRLEGAKLQLYLGNRRTGAGLGLPFAVEMLQRTGVPIGLIPCAHGGTRMNQWDPALRDKGGASLYGSMLRRFRAVGARIRGILWYQGESDGQPGYVENYEAKFRQFIAAVRQDFGQPDLPFYFVQIGRNTATYVPQDAEWARAQEIQRTIANDTPHTGMVASIDLELEDSVHADTASLKRLGRRLANLAVHDLFLQIGAFADIQSGPHPTVAEFEQGVVRIDFDRVNGKLSAEGRISGFSIHDRSGARTPIIVKSWFEPLSRRTVLLRIEKGHLPDGATVRYGFGRDPYCNVRDSADMALPSFGPMAIDIR